MAGSDLTLADQHILSRGGNRFDVYSRANGRRQGWFHIPSPNEFSGFEGRQFGPIVSRGGLIFYKTNPKTHYIFSIQNRTAYFQLWKSETDVLNSVVLRGSMQSVELEVLDEKPKWSIYMEEATVHLADPLMLAFDFLDKITN